MGKVDQVDDAVNHGVAQGDQGIHAALNQTIDHLLKKDIHTKLLLFCCLGLIQFIQACHFFCNL